MSAKMQRMHAGRRAIHVARPCRINRRLNAPRSAAGTTAFSSCSTLTGSLSSVRPNRLLSRRTCVSTGSPGRSKATLRTTLAVFRPTPGTVTKSSSLVGTSPPNRCSSAAAIPMRLRALARKKPVEWMISSSSSGLARAKEAGSGYAPKRAGVTMFTRTSVLCADRIVAASSWNGESWSSAQRSSAVPGNSSANRCATTRAIPFGVLGRPTPPRYRVNVRA